MRGICCHGRTGCTSSQSVFAAISAVGIGITLALYISTIYTSIDLHAVQQSQHSVGSLSVTNARHRVAHQYLHGSSRRSNEATASIATLMQTEHKGSEGNEPPAALPKQAPRPIGDAPNSALSIPPDRSRSIEANQPHSIDIHANLQPPTQTIIRSKQETDVRAHELPSNEPKESSIGSDNPPGTKSQRIPSITSISEAAMKYTQYSEPMPFVIGGSDGSGTRMVANLMQMLGVPLVHSDITTLDLHGDAPDELGTAGWPGLVEPLLRATRSLNYDPDSLDSALHETSRDNVNRLMTKAATKGEDLRQAALKVVERSPEQSTGLATASPWGFKAPASLAIFPMLAKWHGPVRLVHVVRDGRDIAISGNKSPVQRFWGPLFGHEQTKAAMEAVQAGMRGQSGLLWSKWNSGALDWASSAANAGVVRLATLTAPNASSSMTLQRRPSEYAVVRVEDLLKGDFQSRLAALEGLAKLVGSRRTTRQLCCLLSPRYWQSQGSHSKGLTTGSSVSQESVPNLDKFSRASIQLASDRFATGVQNRFGKWRQEFGVSVDADGPATKQAADFNVISKSASEGLATFGYSKSDRGTDATIPGLVTALQTSHREWCTPALWSTKSCITADESFRNLPWLQGENQELEGMADAAGASRRRRCGLQVAMDWRGCPSCRTDIRDVPASTVDDCCISCERTRQCTHFTYDVGRRLCFLKQDGGAAVDAHGGQLISGKLAAE